MINNFNYKIYNEINPSLESIWKNSEKENVSHIFQEINFIKEYIKNKKLNLYFVAIFSGKELLILLPLEIKNFYGIKILQFIGTKEFDYCSPIIVKIKKKINENEFNEIWKKILNDINNYDLILLDKQPEIIGGIENPLVKYFNNTFLSKVYLIRLPNSEKEYFEKFLDKKFLNEFQRTTKKLNLDYDLNFKILENDGAINLSKIINNKAYMLNKKKINHILDEKFVNYFIELNKIKKEFFHISILEINKEIVAANFGFLYKKTFYYYLPTIFSDKFKKYSPGKVLISYLIVWCIKNNISFFDFGMGDESYKKYWSNNNISTFRYLKHKNLKGLFFCLLLKVFKFLKSFKKR